MLMMLMMLMILIMLMMVLYVRKLTSTQQDARNLLTNVTEVYNTQLLAKYVAKAKILNS